MGLAHGTARHPCPTCNRICRFRFLVKLKAPIGATYIKLITPTCSKFEREVRRRKLKLDDQKSLLESRPLRMWAEKHRFRDYIPSELLAAWRLPVPEAKLPNDVVD